LIESGSADAYLTDNLLVVQTPPGKVVVFKKNINHPYKLCAVKFKSGNQYATAFSHYLVIIKWNRKKVKDLDWFKVSSVYKSDD